MRKHYMISAVAAALLVACGGGSDSTQTPPPPPPPTDGVSPGAATGDITSGLTAINHEIATEEIQPSPASIGADVPATYFGNAPSTVQKELIGPYQLLKSGVVDQDAGTITLPLYKGQMADGRLVWYILTDTSDEQNAAALGLNFSSKLVYADVARGARPASQQLIDGQTVVVFEKGTVDFAPEHSLTAGAAPNYFPPTAYQPGSVGDADYSPVAKIGDYIYNAPIVAFDVDEDTLDQFCDGDADHDLVHDKVISICPRDQVVKLQLTQGFSFGRPVLYLSTDASDPLPASMESATYAPGLNDIKVGGDDSAFSAVERIFAFTNGPTNNVPGEINPQRQGFDSALNGEGGPLNVLGGIPTVATDYSPLWDLNIGEWTQRAIDNDYRSRAREEFEILGYVRNGWLTGPGGAPFGSSGLIVDCPIVFRFL